MLMLDAIYLKINITRCVWCFWETRERKSAAGASESTLGNCFKYSESEYLSIFWLTTLNYTINNVGVFIAILFSPKKKLLCHIHIQHLRSDLRDFHGRSTTFTECTVNTLLILLVCVQEDGYFMCRSYDAFWKYTACSKKKTNTCSRNVFNESSKKLSFKMYSPCFLAGM